MGKNQEHKSNIRKTFLEIAIRYIVLPAILTGTLLSQNYVTTSLGWGTSYVFKNVVLNYDEK